MECQQGLVHVAHLVWGLVVLFSLWKNRGVFLAPQVVMKFREDLGALTFFGSTNREINGSKSWELFLDILQVDTLGKPMVNISPLIRPYLSGGW